MTIALCLRCGETKFGALIPCPECGAAPSGHPELDITFSDHYYARTTLDQFGAVIRAIGEQTDDPDLQINAFLEYVTRKHPEVLRITLTDDARPAIDEVLSRIEVDKVAVNPPAKKTLRFLLVMLVISVGMIAFWFFQNMQQPG